MKSLDTRESFEVDFILSEVKLWMGDLGGLTSQLTLPSLGRDVKLGVPCLTTACIVGLNWL